MPKYVIMIIAVAVIIIFSVVRLAIKSSSHHFDCPECGASFQVSFVKYFFTAHAVGGYCQVTCPKCGKSNMLKALSGKQ